MATVIFCPFNSCGCTHNYCTGKEIRKAGLFLQSAKCIKRFSSQLAAQVHFARTAVMQAVWRPSGIYSLCHDNSMKLAWHGNFSVCQTLKLTLFVLQGRISEHLLMFRFFRGENASAFIADKKKGTASLPDERKPPKATKKPFHESTIAKILLACSWIQIALSRRL